MSFYFPLCKTVNEIFEAYNEGIGIMPNIMKVVCGGYAQLKLEVNIIMTV